MSTLFLSVTLLTAIDPPAVAEKPCFQVVLSGSLVAKLPRDTELIFWTTTQRGKGDIFSLSKLPLRLPFDQYVDGDCLVEFRSKRMGDLFSVDLSRTLFDKARKINIKLDPPKPRLRPRLFAGIEVKYVPSMTKRMEYRDLPRWNRWKSRFVPNEAPVLLVSRMPDQKVIQSRAMGERCMRSVWWSYVDTSRMQSGTVYRFSVIYDSGGLFPTQVTTYEFKYDSKRHR